MFFQKFCLSNMSFWLSHLKKILKNHYDLAVMAQHIVQRHRPMLTCTSGPVSQHAFGAVPTAVGSEAVETLDSWEAGLPLTFINILQTSHTWQKHRGNQVQVRTVMMYPSHLQPCCVSCCLKEYRVCTTTCTF